MTVEIKGLETRGQLQVWLRKEMKRLLDIEKDFMLYEIIWGIPCGPIQPKPQWGWGYSVLDRRSHLLPANQTVDPVVAHSARCGMYCSDIQYGSHIDMYPTCERCQELSLNAKVYDVLGIPDEMRL